MDKIEKIGDSIIQHGPFNNRIYLMKFDLQEYSGLLDKLNDLAFRNQYSKIIAKVPASAQPLFLRDGYMPEAYIPEYFKGLEGVFFMAKYFDSQRSIIPHDSLSLLTKLLTAPHTENGQTLSKEFSMAITQPQHAREMALVYQQVFKTYPFPILDASYLEKTMKEGSVIYFGIWDKGKLVGLSSAEMDIPNRNAEMTDFAVLPQYRGHKLASFLLHKMEDEMRARHFNTLYTISRLDSPGITRTFINGGYHFSGILKNNTNISGQIESMNIFYKSLSK